MKSTPSGQNKARVKRRFSSGGVIYRRNDSRVEVAVISRKDIKGRIVWALPKGTIEEGESPEETAVREVKEETGLSGDIENKLGEIEYWYYSAEDRARIFKKVYFYLLIYRSGETSQHDFEVEDVRWVPAEEAINLMTYDLEKNMLTRAMQVLKNEE